MRGRRRFHAWILAAEHSNKPEQTRAVKRRRSSHAKTVWSKGRLRHDCGKITQPARLRRRELANDPYWSSMASQNGWSGATRTLVRPPAYHQMARAAMDAPSHSEVALPLHHELANLSRPENSHCYPDWRTARLSRADASSTLLYASSLPRCPSKSLVTTSAALRASTLFE